MAVLDTRPAGEFLARRLPDAVNIPYEELAARVHELPAAGVEVELCDDDPARLAAATAFLVGRGHAVRRVSGELTESGPSTARLWQPNRFLAEALKIIGRGGAGMTAVDVACGTGRDAVYLGLEGYAVTAIDHLPDAVERAVGLGERYGVAVKGLVHDLERGNDIPVAPADLVCVFRYLHRPLFPAIRGAVRQGGYVVYETFHERNLETGRSPRNPNHLLKTGELAAALAGWEVLRVADAIEREGRFFSHILARRPG